MKTKNWLVAGLVFLVLAPALMASSLEFVGPSYRSGCQCDPQSFELQLNNDASEGEVFTLDIEKDAMTFTAFVTPIVEAPAHSKRPVVAFMTPHCDALPGDYEFTITARGSRGTMLRAKGVSHVEECHYLQLEATPSQSVCGGEETRFVLTLTNAGIFPEKGSISVDLNPQLYSLGDDSFDLQPGKRKEFNLFVVPPVQMPPQKLPFKVTAESQYTYRDTYATLEVLDCSSLEILLPPPCIEVNPGEDITVPVTIRNLGITDVFGVTPFCPPFTSLNAGQVSLAGGESVELELSISPSKEHLNQDFGCTIQARSHRYGKVFTNSTRICVRQLYKVEVSTDLAGDSLTVCRGDPAVITYKITNTGKAATYALSANMGSISASSATLSAGESKSFTVSTDTSNLDIRTYTVSATAYNQFFSTKKDVRLTVENCYEAGLSLSQSQLDICAGETLQTKAVLRNLGTRAGVFALSAQAPQDFSLEIKPAQLSIAGGSQAEASVFLTALWTAQAGATHSIPLTARDGSSATTTLTARVLTDAECHSITIKADALEKKVEVCQGVSFELTLKNNGRFTEQLSLSVEGPNWVFVTPPDVTINPGEEKTAYVFASPPFNTEKGKYTIVFKAENERIRATQSLVVDVYPVGGLGQQVPDYESPDYELALSAEALEFEEGVFKPIGIVLENKGIAPLTDVMVFFESDDLQVMNESIAPVLELLPGQPRRLTFLLKPVRNESTLSTTVRAVSKEKFVEVVKTLSVKPATLSIQETRQDFYTEGNTTKLKVTLNVSNTGHRTTLKPRLLGGLNASFDAGEYYLEPTETEFISFTTDAPTLNQSFTVLLESDRGTYSRKVSVSPQAWAATGLFTLTATLAAFLLALVAGAVALYLVMRRPSKPSKPAPKPRKKAKRKK